jgi:hypothetical protein
VFIIFRGRVYTQQPVLLTVTNYLWSRLLRKLRLIRQVTPVIAAVASPSCDIERYPGEWSPENLQLDGQRSRNACQLLSVYE